MLHLENLAPAGAIVIAVILILFVLAVIMLIATYLRYRLLQRDMGAADGGRSAFSASLKEDFCLAYRRYGQGTNTPAIINNAVATRLGKTLFCERFMNNAVSLFVTLGLFGTFLGLALSVSSLTQLISLSSSEEWLSILDSVGGGLVSALSGMGVAFYTSLVGVACSIVFTLLRAAFNPQAQREQLETAAELWLDHVVAPQETTDVAFDDESRLLQLKDELRLHAAAVEQTLNNCTLQMEQVLNATTKSLGDMITYSKEPLSVFYNTVSTFNENVRDFSEFNYDLRGNIERMDVAFRDLGTTLNKTNRTMNERAHGAALAHDEPADAADPVAPRGIGGGRRQ